MDKPKNVSICPLAIGVVSFERVGDYYRLPENTAALKDEVTSRPE